MTEKPLHVRVAEALGWKKLEQLHRDIAQRVGVLGPHVEDSFEGREPAYGELEMVPRYDTDWSATGPLIERFGLTLTEDMGSWHACRDGGSYACMEMEHVYVGEADQPLLAVCNLILALHAAGKLPSSRSPRPTEPPSPLG